MPVEDCLARGSPPLPWLFEAAATFAGEAPADLYTDPGAVARSLAHAAELFELPAVVSTFDTTVEAEALGAPVAWTADGPAVERGVATTLDDLLALDPEVVDRSRVPAAVEVVERLQLSARTSILGGVTGPARLADQVLETDNPADDQLEEAAFLAGDVATAVGDALLDAGADGLAVLEPGGLLAADLTRTALGPVANLLDHYGAVGVVVAEEVRPATVSLVADLGLDAAFGRVSEPAACLEAAADREVAVGAAVPRAAFLEGPGAVREAVASLPPGAVPTSEWTVSPDATPEAIQALMDTG